MKKLKKVLALGLAGAMALSLAACGGSETSEATSEAAGDSTATTEAADGEVVTLKWVMVGNGMPANYDAWLEQINPYLEEKIGVNLDMEVVGWGDWDQRRNVIVNTAGEYDILFTNVNTYTNDVGVGAFYDITDLLPEVAPDLWASIPADYWDACRVGGQIYAVPAMKDSSITNFVVWDKGAMDAAGYDGSTMTDLTDPALTEALGSQELKDYLTSNGYPDTAWPLNNSGATYLTFEYDTMGAGLIAMGVKYNDGEGKVVSIYEQPEIMEYLDLFHQWYQDGIINADANVKPEDNAYKPAAVAQGWPSAAITTWGPNMGVEEAVAYQWGPTIVSNDSVRGSLSCISANCQYPEKALQLLELVNTDTYVRDLLYYGVQGDNWDYTDDTKQWVHKNNADWTMAGYTQGSFFTVTPTDDFDFNQYDEVAVQNENAEPSVLLGFSMDVTPVSDQLNQCISIAESYKSELLTGSCGGSDPETMVAQMVEELNAAGFQEVIAEAQAQVDAFLAENPASATAETAE